MPMNPRLLVPRAAGGFDPRKIAGLTAWLDASHAPSLFQNSDGTVEATAASDPVGYWGDRSGNGNHATQSINNNRASISSSTINGRRTLTFDGSNDNYAFITSSLQPSSVFVVANCSTSGNFPAGKAIIASNVSDRPLAWIENSRWEFVRWGQNMVGPVATDGTTNLLSSTNDGSISTLRVNGANAVTNSGGTFSAGALRIGAAGTTQFFVGFIAEILIYNSSLSALRRGEVELYLSRKWGLALA